MTDMRSVDLAALNSATKYPSIPTYHAMGEKGRLTDEVTGFTGRVVLTEKVDGTSARIIAFPDGGFILGSREELLHAKGDLIANPTLGIVAALADQAATLPPPGADGVRVYFLEVYGGSVGSAAKQYTGHRAVGYRLFDAASIPAEILDRPREQISSWRQDGGQVFWSENDLAHLSRLSGIEQTPRLGGIDAADLPTSIEDTDAFLSRWLPHTRVALDDDAGGAAEGIVLRTVDRSVIAKARVEDYRRTIKHRATAR